MGAVDCHKMLSAKSDEDLFGGAGGVLKKKLPALESLWSDDLYESPG